MGAAALTLPVSASAAPAPLRTSESLLSPLTAGSQLGRWMIEEIHPLSEGSTSLVLRSQRGGDAFQLDICARDREAGAHQGPGVTEHFSVYVANNGNGALSTVENQGLAAMAVADVIRGNETTVDRSGYRTLRQCVAARAVRRHVE